MRSGSEGLAENRSYLSLSEAVRSAMKSLRIWGTFVCVVGLALPVAGQSGDPIVAGNGTIYLGAFPNRIFVIDEATQQVVDEIEVSIGTPRSLMLSEDRSRFYMLDATFEKFEIIDVARRETIDTFTLSEGNKRARIRSYRVHPDGSYVILVVDRAVKLVDRFEIEPLQLLQYDLRTHEVIREIPWPGGEARTRAAMLFSLDGRWLYYFDSDVRILETETFTEVDRWALSKPIEDGLGRVNFTFARDLINEDPGFFTGNFSIHDEVQDRDLMGIARIDLLNRKMDFYTLGPAVGTLHSFALSPGRQKAYGLSSEIGHYEFWTFDLENRRLAARQPFLGRPRMALKVSSNGKILYIYQAGRTIDFYDAESYAHLQTLTLDGDMTTGLFVLPSDD